MGIYIVCARVPPCLAVCARVHGHVCTYAGVYFMCGYVRGCVGTYRVCAYMPGCVTMHSCVCTVALVCVHIHRRVLACAWVYVHRCGLGVLVYLEGRCPLMLALVSRASQGLVSVPSCSRALLMAAGGRGRSEGSSYF